MPCLQNTDTVVASNYQAANLFSQSIASIKTEYAEITDYSTVMLGSSKSDTIVQIGNGHIDAAYIIISKRADLNLGNTKLIGNVAIVDAEDFNNIYWTWTSRSMNKYLAAHKIPCIEYKNEPLSAHFDELTAKLEELVLQEEAVIEQQNIAEIESVQAEEATPSVVDEPAEVVAINSDYMQN